MLKKREVIISQVTSRIRIIIYKHGIEVPTSIKHAADIYSRNNNTYWRDDIAKEMSSIGVAFDILETGQMSPVGFKRTSDHIIFDVKWNLLLRLDGC